MIWLGKPEGGVNVAAPTGVVERLEPAGQSNGRFPPLRNKEDVEELWQR
jgi:hypothetical protein